MTAFERNLAALLARHVPVTAEPAFRARLERRFVDEAERLAAARRAEAAPQLEPPLRLPARGPRPSLAAAALVLVALGAAAAWYLAGGGTGRSAADGDAEHVVRPSGVDPATGDELPDVGALRGSPSVAAGPGAPKPLVVPAPLLDITPAPGVLTGRIVRDEDDSPVTSARLVLASTQVTGPDSSWREVSDPDGRFRWEDPPAGRYHLFVQAEGLAVEVTRHVRIDDQLTLPALQVRLPRGQVLRGVVRDDATGAPVPGALVVSDTDAPALMLALDEDDLPHVVVARARTDAQGRFELRDLSRGAPQVLRASAPGLAPTWVTVEASAPAVGGAEAATAEVEIRLPAGGAVEGQAWRASGEPWEGAGLVASFMPPTPAARCMVFDTTHADAQGRYRIADLPALQGVVLLFDDLESPTAMPEMQSMTVRAGATTRVDFGAQWSPAPGQGVLVGTLLEAGGRPAVGRMLSIMEQDCPDPSSEWVGAMVDEAGRWQVAGLAPGGYDVYLVLGVEGTIALAGSVELPPGGGGARLDLQVPEGVLEGRVLRPDGEPLAHAVVIVEGRETSGDWRFIGRCLADAAGAYRAEALAPGVYRALGFDWNGLFGAGLSEQVLVGAGTQVLDLVLQVGGRVRVTAADAAGAPLAGARVLLRDDRGRAWSLHETSLTNGDGTLLLQSVPAGRWEVEAVLAGHAPARTVVDVAVGAQAEAPLVLPRAE